MLREEVIHPDGEVIERWFDDAGIEVAADVAEAQGKQDQTEVGFMRQRIPAVLAKARAVMTDPVNAADFTVVERKVILAALVLDLAQRRR